MSLSYFYDRIKALETGLRCSNDLDGSMIFEARLDLAMAYYRRAYRAWQESLPRYIWSRP